MKSNDFLYSRQEKLSEEFAKDLWEQLQEQDKKQRPKTAIWTAVAASLVTGMVGFLLIFNQLPNMTAQIDIPVNMPTFTQHDTITVNNLDQLQPFAHLGNGTIHNIQMMPDGEHLLVAASTGIYLHNADSLNSEPQKITSETISHLDVDMEGNIYGVISLPPRTNHPPQSIVRWDAVTGERREIVQLSEAVINLGNFSVKPDGSQMMVQTCAEVKYSYFNWKCVQHEFSWYDIETGERLLVDTPNIPNNDVVLGQSTISDDWSYIAYFVDNDNDPNTYEYHLELIDINTREMRTVLTSKAPPPHMNIAAALNGLMLSPDGKRLLLQPIGMEEQAIVLDTEILWDSDEPINFWLNDEATLYQTAEFDKGYFSGYTFSPDGNSLFAQSSDTLLGYELTGEADLSLEPTIMKNLQINDRYRTLIFRPDGQTMFALYGWFDSTIVYGYETTTLEITDTLSHYDSQHSQELHFTDDGTQVAIGNRWRSLPSIWTINVDPPIQEHFLLDGALKKISHFTLSPDGKTVAYQLGNFGEDDQLLWLGSRDDSNIRQIVDRNNGHFRLDFLSDGSLLGFVRRTGLVHYSVEDILDDNLDPEVNQLHIPGVISSEPTLTGVSRIAVSPDSQWIAVSRCYREADCAFNDFIVWSMETNNQVTLVTDEIAFKEYGSMAFSPDNQLFAFGYCLSPFEIVNSSYRCDAGEVRIYSVEELVSHDSTYSDPISLEPLATLTGFEELPMNISFSPVRQPDDSWLIAITEWNKSTQLWQISEDGETEILRVFDNIKQPVVFDPNGGFMFTTTDTAQTEVWGVPLIGAPSQ